MRKIVLILLVCLILGLITSGMFAQEIEQRILETKAGIGELSIQEKQLQGRLGQVQQAYNQMVQQLSDLLNQKQREEEQARLKEQEEQEASKKAEEEAAQEQEKAREDTAINENIAPDTQLIQK